MEQPSEVAKSFYEFCRQCIQQLRERPKTADYLGEAFTFEQAFWIHFVSMALCTWDDDAEYEIRLTEIFAVFLAIYREEIAVNMSKEDELLFVKSLKDRFDAASTIFFEEENSKAGMRLAHLALGEEINVIRLTLAALDIPSFSATNSPLPFRLVEDI